MGSANSEDRFMKRAFLSPAVFILLALSIFPLIWSLGISFTDMQRGGSTIARQAAADGITDGVGFFGLGQGRFPQDSDKGIEGRLTAFGLRQSGLGKFPGRNLAGPDFRRNFGNGQLEQFGIRHWFHPLPPP